MSTPAFLASDTWLLVALLQATREKSNASLGELVRAADAANHAIITRGELETGFSRLVPAGHATITGAGYAPSGTIREFWSKNAGPKKSLYKSWDKLAAFIGAPATSAGPPPESDEENYVRKSEYAAALQGYTGNDPR